MDWPLPSVFSMKIALFGYGKMGKKIEQLATDRGHEVVAKIDLDSDAVNLSEAQVAIDFSAPEAAFGNISKCLQQGIPVISGTTGWLQDFDKAVSLCKKESGAFLYASNFSLGVNVFFALNRFLATKMSGLKQYETSLEETHHTQKLDAPSGTAITLAEGIIAESDYDSWSLDAVNKSELNITSKRIGEVPGTHIVRYESEVDGIEIKHTAHNRSGFALGAIIAAEWIIGKTGVFTMSDVLKLG